MTSAVASGWDRRRLVYGEHYFYGNVAVWIAAGTLLFVWPNPALRTIAVVFGVALLGLPRRSFDAMIAALGLYLVVLGALHLVRALEAQRRGVGTDG